VRLCNLCHAHLRQSTNTARRWHRPRRWSSSSRCGCRWLSCTSQKNRKHCARTRDPPSRELQVVHALVRHNKNSGIARAIVRSDLTRARADVAGKRARDAWIERRSESSANVSSSSFHEWSTRCNVDRSVRSDRRARRAKTVCRALYFWSASWDIGSRPSTPERARRSSPPFATVLRSPCRYTAPRRAYLLSFIILRYTHTHTHGTRNTTNGRRTTDLWVYFSTRVSTITLESTYITADVVTLSGSFASTC